jgi:hypothetical protein
MLNLLPLTAPKFKVGVPYIVVRVEKNTTLNISYLKALGMPTVQLLPGGRRLHWFRAEVSYTDAVRTHSYRCERTMSDIGMPEWDETIEHEHRTFLDTPENRLVLEHLAKHQNLAEYRRIIAA